MEAGTGSATVTAIDWIPDELEAGRAGDLRYWGCDRMICWQLSPTLTSLCEKSDLTAPSKIAANRWFCVDRSRAATKGRLPPKLAAPQSKAIFMARAGGLSPRPRLLGAAPRSALGV